MVLSVSQLMLLGQAFDAIWEQLNVVMRVMILHRVRLFVQKVFVKIPVAPMEEPMVHRQPHTYGDVNMPEMFVVENKMVSGIAIEMESGVESVAVKMTCPIAGHVHKPVVPMGLRHRIPMGLSVQLLQTQPQKQLARIKDIAKRTTSFVMKMPKSAIRLKVRPRVQL